MKLRCIYSIYLIFMWSSSFSQMTLKEVKISFGYSMQKEDRRLFEYPNKEEILARESEMNEIQIELLINKHIYDYHKISISAGLGYTQMISYFGRPFDHNYFTGGRTKELRFIHNYYIHNIKIRLSPSYKLLLIKNSELDILFPIDLTFPINKSIKSGSQNVDKWNLQIGKIEFNLGLNYRIKKFDTSISYRILNIQTIDEVIFNTALYHSNANVFTKDIEYYNLFKLNLNVGYSF